MAHSAITFGSVCSGIEAASVAWSPLGWESAWLSEIDPFANALLAHRYPEVPNLGDMTQIARMVQNGYVSAPDILVGGTPCQAFAICGLRQSLSDPRGQLTLSFVELANAIDCARAKSRQSPAIILWENVPGALTTQDNAFGHFLAGLAGEDCALVAPRNKWPDAGCVIGPSRTVAWRVLDAQYFRLAQRRRRLFVMASDRSWIDPTKILFEWESSRRDSPPCREEGPQNTWPIAPCLTKSGRGISRVGEIGGQDTVIAYSNDIAACLTKACLTKACLTKACLTKAGSDQETLIAFRAAGQDGFAPSSISPPLLSSNGGGSGVPTISYGWKVRRITPEEAEALQGFPRHYTRIWYRNKLTTDQPRYSALGNTMAVNVMAWLGARIAAALRLAVPPVVN